MRSWDFQAPGLIAFGEGKAAGIGALVKGRISGKVLLVTGPVLLRSGTVDPVLRSLREAARLSRSMPRPAANPPACMRMRPCPCSAARAARLWWPAEAAGPWIWPRP